VGHLVAALDGVAEIRVHADSFGAGGVHAGEADKSHFHAFALHDQHIAFGEAHVRAALELHGVARNFGHAAHGNILGPGSRGQQAHERRKEYHLPLAHAHHGILCTRIDRKACCAPSRRRYSAYILYERKAQVKCRNGKARGNKKSPGGIIAASAIHRGNSP